MMHPRILGYLAILVTLISSAILMASTEETIDSSAVPHPLDKVAVIGASASAGWGLVLRYVDDEELVVTRLVTLNDVLKACILREKKRILLEGSGLFFWNPEGVGGEQAEEAREQSPTLLIALDYLFWFGYGNKGPNGTAIPSGTQGHDARLELLEVGLAELDRFKCPILVGDFPDMSKAVGYMLGLSQMPAPETLKALNRRLREWAGTHPNVTIVPVAGMIESMKMKRPFMAGRQQWPRDSHERFIQRDNLHPTLDGLIVFTQESLSGLVEADPLIEEDEFDFDLESVRNRIYERNRPEGTSPNPYSDSE